MPFSGGQRICLGKNLAIMEAKMVLGAIFKNFHLELISKSDIQIHAGATLGIDGGLTAQIKAI
jgi:cytochrome P450